MLIFDDYKQMFYNNGNNSVRKRGGKAKYRGISKDCVLVARDRQKMTYSGGLGRGRIRTTKLDEAIGGHLSDSNVLCTDAWRAFSSYANGKGLAHYHFNGVETKYLQYYLAWFRYIDSKEYENTSSNKKNMLVKSCLFTVTDTNAKLRISTY